METSKSQKLSGSRRGDHQDLWTFPRWKRVLDITIILLTVPIWLGAMIVIALAISCLSPGPVFFLQERVVFMGRRFWCLKFRSMKVNADTTCHEGHLRELLKSDRPMTKLDASGDTRLVPCGK